MQQMTVAALVLALVALLWNFGDLYDIIELQERVLELEQRP